MVLQVSELVQAPVITFEKLPTDYILPDDPVDNINQPALAAALTEALFLSGKVSETTLISTNYGICATVNGQIVVKAPDWAYVPEIHVVREEVFRSYTPQLQGECPVIVMEFLSDTDGGEYSSKPTYPPGKWYFYEQVLQVLNYAIFEPASGDLEVYRRDERGNYRLQLINAAGHYDIPELQLSLGVWQGEREGRTGYWLRWWDPAGNLLLWGNEKIEQEKHRADALAAKLRELGFDPENG